MIKSVHMKVRFGSSREPRIHISEYDIRSYFYYKVRSKISFLASETSGVTRGRKTRQDPVLTSLTATPVSER